MGTTFEWIRSSMDFVRMSSGHVLCEHNEMQCTVGVEQYAFHSNLDLSGASSMSTAIGVDPIHLI